MQITPSQEKSHSIKTKPPIFSKIPYYSSVCCRNHQTTFLILLELKHDNRNAKFNTPTDKTNDVEQVNSNHKQ